MIPDPDFYRHNYDGFECLESFSSTDGLERYRASLLEKSRLEVEFITRHIPNVDLKVLEFCCGNGRLLMALARRGALSHGLGIEISPDRVRFANQWIDDTEIDNVVCLQADVLQFEPDPGRKFDLVACISGAFGYFRVIDVDAPNRVFELAHRALKPGGYLLLELFQLTDDFRTLLRLTGGPTRTWLPLPPSDPFAYQLDEFEYSSSRRILKRNKTYIRRDGRIDASRVEFVADHSQADIETMGSAHGFHVVGMYADFSGSPFHAGATTRLVGLLKRD